MSQARDAGIQALKSGSPQVAAQHLVRAVQENPQDVQAIGFLGAAYGQLNMPDKAVECLARAAGLAPQSAAIRFNLGMAQEKAGRRDAAVASYREAVRLDANYERARQALTRLGESPTAAAAGAVTPAPPAPAPAAPPAPSAVGDFLIPGAAPASPASGGPAPHAAAPPAYPQAAPPAYPPPPAYSAAPAYPPPPGAATLQPGAYSPPPPSGGPAPLGAAPGGYMPPPPPTPMPSGPPGGMVPLGDWTPPPQPEGGLANYQTAPSPGSPYGGSEYGPPPVASGPATRGEVFAGRVEQDRGVSRKQFTGQCYLSGMGMGVWWGLLGAGSLLIRSMTLPGSEWGRLLPVILTGCMMVVALGALLYGGIGLLGSSTDDAETMCGNAGLALGILTGLTAFVFGSAFTLWGGCIGAFGGLWVSRQLGRALGGNINEMQSSLFVVAGHGGVGVVPTR